MDLKFFYSTYNLLEDKVISVISTGDTLEIKLEVDVDVNYIANGFRPTFEYEQVHLFVFSEKLPKFAYFEPKIKDYIYIEDKIVLVIEDREISITTNDITCL